MPNGFLQEKIVVGNSREGNSVLLAFLLYSLCVCTMYTHVPCVSFCVEVSMKVQRGHQHCSLTSLHFINVHVFGKGVVSTHMPQCEWQR